MLFGQYPTPPKQIILDLDVTDDKTHGAQEGAEFKAITRAPVMCRCIFFAVETCW